MHICFSSFSATDIDDEDNTLQSSFCIYACVNVHIYVHKSCAELFYFVSLLFLEVFIIRFSVYIHIAACAGHSCCLARMLYMTTASLYASFLEPLYHIACRFITVINAAVQTIVIPRSQ